MNTTESELKLARGVELAREKAQAAGVRNVRRADTVDISWLEAMIADGGEDDGEQEQEPSRVSKLPPFVLEGVHDQVRAAHAAVTGLVAGVLGDRPARPHWLSLLGGCGVGKTHLLRLARAMLLDAGEHVQLWGWGDILDRLRSGQDDLMRHLGEARVVLLDDVGAEFTATGKALEFSLATLYTLQNLREGKWTVMTSNLSARGLADADERVASRLVRNGGEVVTLDQARDWALARYKARRAAV